MCCLFGSFRLSPNHRCFFVNLNEEHCTKQEAVYSLTNKVHKVMFM